CCRQAVQHFFSFEGTGVASQSAKRSPCASVGPTQPAINHMKPVIVIALSLLLCSCADMYVTKTEVATPGGRTAVAIDAKDYGSKGVHMITNCGIGASNPRAIYIRPFCIDTAVFKVDEALSD